MSAEVAAVFSSFAPAVNAALLKVRALIFDVARQTPAVGRVSEALRWGEPAYLTVQTRSRSTIRLGASKHQPGDAAMFVNCRTTLVAEFSGMFGEVFLYEGNRALVFSADRPLPDDAMRIAIRMALTYHRRRVRALPGATDVPPSV